MDPAKIALSADELALVQNVDWLLTKNTITAKAYALFGQLWEEIGLIGVGLGPAIADNIFLIPAKISKGENYQGLPYVMLDYPRRFTKENIFAIRTMFWWGNFISVTLHLKGTYKEQFLPALKKNTDILTAGGFYIAVHEDEWRHDFEADNYIQLAGLDASESGALLSDADFCKLAVRMPLEHWNEAKQRLTAFYTILFRALRY